MMDQSYAVMAEILNVPEDHVHIGASTTAHTYTLARAFGEILGEGDNIIVTNQDHEANSGYWRKLAERGVDVREWQVNAQGLLDVDDLWPLVDDKTHFAAFPHVSNIIGQINPVAEIAKGLREKGVLSIVDGVSYAPHAWPDLGALGADIYFFSTYKTYGPHQGVLVMSPELAQKLPNQGHEFNAGDLRKRFNPAGPDHAQVAGIAAIGDYIGAVYERHEKTRDALGDMARSVSKLQRKHETKLLNQLFEGLAELGDMQVLGSTKSENRVPTVSIFNKETRAAKMAKQMSKRGIMTAGGNFYAPRVLKALGIDPAEGVLRLSLVHYNSEDDVKKILKALRKIND